MTTMTTKPQTPSLSSDRYDHDMTAQNFLNFLYLIQGVGPVTRPVPSGPAAVRQFLNTRGFKVADVCNETVTLADHCGCRYVRALPPTIVRAMIALNAYTADVGKANAKFTLIDTLEARI